MMHVEDSRRDYKSIRKAIGKQADLKSLAETCVAFANAQGGEIIIGIEDKDSAPPANQRINSGSAKSDIQKAVYRMVVNNLIEIEGAKRNRTYDLSKKK
jgi:predicted HTH transcriptional regulator